MLFERIESKGLAQYSYIIGDRSVAVVIDPRRDSDVYIELALAQGMQITDIVETHRHEDFVVGSPELAARTGARAWHADAQLPYKYGQAVADGQVWEIGWFTLRAIHTPGHTEGSMSYVLYEPGDAPWLSFTGDVLFTGEVGRVDFLGMDRAPAMAGHLYDSIFGKLLPLGDGVVVCPGHGYGSACGSTIADRPLSTLGLERALNPRLQVSGREAFIAEVARKLPKPQYFEKMETWNLQGPPDLGTLPAPKSLPPTMFVDAMREAVVIDTRDMFSFAGGHIPDALSLSLDNLPSYIGWYVPPDTPLLLVMDDNDPMPAVRYLVRQGYDDIVGCLAGGMFAWSMAGLPLATTPLVRPADLSSHPHSWILDVRNPEDFVAGALPGAVNISHKYLAERLDEVPSDRPICTYCAAGPRSMAAASALQRAGHASVSVLLGGINRWAAEGLPVKN
ncbi:MAG: MBL fold metallo-hydrolase [Anaerolineae bacterium]|nr:MBL fold metallo-hydrolase [Anaerolineae bacterium]